MILPAAILWIADWHAPTKMRQNHGAVKTFALAPMSPPIRWLTVLLLLLPVVFATMAGSGAYVLWLPALILMAIYSWIWLRFRPSAFVVHANAIEVIWPLRRHRIPRDEISAVRIIDSDELTREIGWGARVGVGGLWGGFGWLWTRRRGIVQMYISRTDRYVWIECGTRKPWLLTPDRPEEFAKSIGGPGEGVKSPARRATV
jgi:hypothetical protein